MKKFLVPLLALLVGIGASATATADPGTPTTPAPRSTTHIVVHFENGSSGARTVARSGSQANVVTALGTRLQRQIEAAAGRVGVRVLRAQANAGGATTLQLSDAVDAGEATALAAELTGLPGVASAEPGLRLFASDISGASVQPGTPSDPEFPQQWGLAGAFGIAADRVWGQTTGAGVTVAVVDTGITAHPDLAPNVVGGYDFYSEISTSRDGNGRDADPSDPGDWIPAGKCGEPAEVRSSWHGTHVAGIVAAVGNNGQGITGVAPGAKVVPIRVLGYCGGSDSDIADAIVWAAGGDVPGVRRNLNPARIINLSLGGVTDACPAILQRAVTSAVSRGSVVVVAAGNESMDAGKSAPGNCRGVVTVAATGETGRLAFYSNAGSVVALSAPGGDSKAGARIRSTWNAGTRGPLQPTYASIQGSSQATPMVSGALALLWGPRPALRAAQLVDALRRTARPVADCGGCGSGLIDVAAAWSVVKALPTPTPPKPPTPPVDIYGTPGEHVVNGRRWFTKCEPYSKTKRCRTDIWASQVKLVGGKYVTTTGWLFNNLTYLAAPRAMWAGNPLAVTGTWVSGGRAWRTECDTALTGRNGCRSWAQADVIEAYRNSRGAQDYRVVRIWVVNNMVRFS